MNVFEMQARVAERAYAIWQAEGCPDGQSESNWHRAEAEIAAEVTPIAKPKRKPAAKAEAAPAEKAPARRRAKAA